MMKFQIPNSKFQKILVFLVGIICVALTSLPLFHAGFFRPHDFTHAARIAEMYRSLLGGEFPVRWSENFGFGYGMPLFNFYAPLPYYLAQIPYSLTQSAIFSIKFLYVLNSTLAFIGMYLFAKEFWKNTFSATISAILFTFASYRAVDLYVRGAVGEVFAMALLPLVLFGILRLQKNRWQGTAIVSLSLAAVILSHNLMGMISMGIAMLFGVLFVNKRYLCLSIALSVALSAFYSLPAFFEKQFTRVEQTITTGYFDYHNHFVAIRQFFTGIWGYGGSQPGLDDGISFALGWIPTLLCILTIVGFFGFKMISPFRQSETKFPTSKIIILSFLLLGSLFMATNKSLFIWEHIGVLKYMQFPWRFLAFVHVFLAAFGGGSVILFSKNRTYLFFIASLVVGVIFAQVHYFFPENIIINTDQYYSTDTAFIRAQTSKTLNDYLPPSIHDGDFPTPITERLGVERGDGKISMLSNTPSQLEGNIECDGRCTLRVNIFAFPDWTVTIDGKETTLEADDLFPVSYFTVPTGTTIFSIQLRDSPIRKIANLLSVAGIIVWMWIIKKYYRQKRSGVDH